MDYQHGWFQVTFTGELPDQEIIETVVGNRRLLLVRTSGGLQAYDAACPHRGANLAYGGRLAGDNSVICPFHGYRITLGGCNGRGLRLRQYPTLVAGELVLVRLSDDYENGLTGVLTELSQNYYIMPGFTREIKTGAALVIENGFDSQHFRTVHNISNLPRFQLRPSQQGELTVEGLFEIPPPAVEPDRAVLVKVPFTARAFSPGLVISQLGGVQPYAVITAATPNPEGHCRMRLSLALPGKLAGQPPDRELWAYLVEQSKIGIARDEMIWEHLIPGTPTQLSIRDHIVIAFNRFCRQFEQAETAVIAEAKRAIV
jgi:phenylpropionate dioxygenase-like ring-hydroxylating dioxygenase large terminal subunit